MCRCWAEKLSTAATQALIDVAVEVVSLPPGWGWSTESRAAYRSNALACGVLAWAETEAPERAVEALAQVEPRLDPVREAMRAKAPPGLALPSLFDPSEEQSSDALAWLAFASRGFQPGRYGLIAAELDDVQRTAVAAMGRRVPAAADALRRLGLFVRTQAEVERFLEGTVSEWRPIPVSVGGETRRWHFGALWGAAVFGEVDVLTLSEAVHAAMTPAEAVDAVTRFSVARMPAFERIEGPDAWRRDQELALAILDRAVGRGFDLRDMLAAVAADTRSGLPAIAALAWLRANPGEIAPEYRALVEAGVAQARVAEPLSSLAAVVLGQ